MLLALALIPMVLARGWQEEYAPDRQTSFNQVSPFICDIDTDKDSYIMSVLDSDDLNMNNYINSHDYKAHKFPPITKKPKWFQRSIDNGDIPDYVTQYSPLVYLYSEERYFPYDIADFVKHFHVENINNTIVKGTNHNMTINKLGDLKNNSKLWLTANSDFDCDPDWITGVKNKPSLIDGEIKNAPATLIVVDKGYGWVDSYWFYFYSFNLGPFVMGAGPYGNHVGDWEHLLVRFYKGKPIIVWMSAHGGGGGYSYNNLEKYHLDPKHPIIFSATGTHANYVSVGQHPHDLPYNILSDFTDRGPLWNPAKNYLGYTYDGRNIYIGNNTTHKGREELYGHWLAFKGHWGDKQLPANDTRQKYNLIGGHKYIDGPTGPMSKNLIRLVPCERVKWWNFWGGCNIRKNIKWGIGVESEGYNCGTVFYNVKPLWLRRLLLRITWGGGLCFLIDAFTG